MAFEKYEMDGQVYNYNPKNGGWFDSSYTKVSMEEMYKLNKLRTDKLDFANMETGELLRIAQGMKDSEDYIYSVKIFDELLKRKDDVGTVNKVLPRYTSVLRSLNRHREAIEMFEMYFEKYGKSVYSPAVFTSIAAAYCDIGDVETARHMANIARGMSAGKSGPELINAYSRIKSMEK